MSNGCVNTRRNSFFFLLFVSKVNYFTMETWNKSNLCTKCHDASSHNHNDNTTIHKSLSISIVCKKSSDTQKNATMLWLCHRLTRSRKRKKKSHFDIKFKWDSTRKGRLVYKTFVYPIYSWFPYWCGDSMFMMWLKTTYTAIRNAFESIVAVASFGTLNSCCHDH